MNCPDCSPTREVLDGYFVCNSEHYCIEDSNNEFVFQIMTHDYIDDSEYGKYETKYCTCGWIKGEND
tara:strand:- start:245 stop:445 length:201 start_codon:yes stop_codon:yes gene_type:complete